MKNIFVISACVLLAGCPGTTIPLSNSQIAQIPQEFTQPVQTLDTVETLEKGLTNPELWTKHGRLRQEYGVCQRRHAGLSSAIGLRDETLFPE